MIGSPGSGNMPQIDMQLSYGFGEWTDVYQMNQDRPWSGNGEYSVTKEYLEVVKAVQQAVMDAVPVSTGDLKSTIWLWKGQTWPTGIQAAVGAGGIGGITGRPVVYATAVNAGSKPHTPPLLYLAGWVLNNWFGVTPSNIARKASYLQKDIKLYGTRPQPYFEVGLGVARAAQMKYGYISVTFNPR